MRKYHVKITMFIFLIMHLFILTISDLYVYTHTKNFLNFSYRYLFYVCSFFLIFEMKAPKVIKGLLIFLLYVVDISEGVCYYTTYQSFNFQFISAIDFQNGISDQPVLATLAFIAIGIALIFSCATAVDLDLSYRYDFCAYGITSYCLFHYLLIIKKDFSPFSEVLFHFNSEFIGRFNEYMDSPIESSQPPNVKPRNFITFLLESFELQNLGTYNPQRKDLTPFLTNLAKETTVFTNVIKQPFSGWSIASLFAVMCDLPMITDGHTRYDQGHFHLNKNFKCFPDHLHKLNYRNILVAGSYPNIGNFVDFLKMHHYTPYLVQQHGCRHDDQLTKWMIDHFIPKLANDYYNNTNSNNTDSKRPFNLLFYLADTHVGRYKNRCGRKNDGLTSYMNEAECTDGYIKQVYETFQKYNLLENTEVIIYGDHSVMSNNHNFQEPDRNLLLMVPSRKFGEVKTNMTLYDYSHLILNLLDVKYKPNFPFGSNPLQANHVIDVPEKADLNYLYNRFQKEMKFNPNPKGYFNNTDRTEELKIRNYTKKK
ncbi:hypothetical protein TRFO_30657 [Tritrichomonas foetus]|uniref:Sulfatase N-terminal domain-containing protein n=1 Tax=Tritrichomonas foetus TaxID=1144522 RepID=A0A1J4JU60_9EUKA|nr:hypothetical protein TRFO_30657 [Tritrichomonas foetus]|eukprot:OHT02250.1 hypothetical protein TRFO_30657 [Tritrichomonas foetus]